MRQNRMLNAGKWNYSGVMFRTYLRQHNISYKEAAEVLGINKNTVGKAVRGGNLNINILLRICQVYGLDLRDFFEQISPKETEMTDDAKSDIAQARIAILSRMIDHLQSRIAELSEQLREGYALLRKLTK